MIPPRTGRGRLALAVAFVVAAVIVIGFGYLVALSVFGVDRNGEAIDAIQADRAARIAERCTRDHKSFLADKAQLDLLDALIHQTDIDDPRLQLTPEQHQLFVESRATSESLIKESRELIAQSDCDPKGSP